MVIEKKLFRISARHTLTVTLVLALCLASGCPEPEGLDKPVIAVAEPDAATAALWWPPQRNVWTPIGWKDHLFRFNVLYNGTVIAQPDPVGREVTAKWASQGVQLTVSPSATGEPPAQLRREPYQLCSLPDRGLGLQGWNANPTPVLRTEWPLEQGLVLKEEIFAHVPGGEEVQTGIEPLYAWVRLSVSQVDELKAPESFSFLLQLDAVHIRRTMEQEANLLVFPERSAYPRKLKFEEEAEGPGTVCRIVEPDGRVRLAAVSGADIRFRFEGKKPVSAGGAANYFLTLTLPAREGAHADLLLPMLPEEREAVGRELDLGYENALAECDRYWSAAPATAARIETPEKQLDKALEMGVKFAEIIAEKNPETGDYSFLSGAWQYDRLWPTPTSMTAHMLLDVLGYHEAVERHIELFRKFQGSVKPPGPSYQIHPGYFSSPKSLTSIDWLADHGAILYEVSRHALLTGDKEFTGRWLEAVIRGCEFIRDNRLRTDHDCVKGVLPPAVATDRGVTNQSAWSIGWNYKGLCEAAKLLNKTGNPRAAEFEQECRDYRESFIAALRQSALQMPQWTDSRGEKHRMVPHALSDDGGNLHAFYLDAGPLFLVWSGLLSASDELMRETLLFLREGPNTKVYDPRGNCWQRPVLIHEMSSCEPCYSWNAYHSWQLGDRPRYLECLYSLLTGALSPQTYISCETREGIYGNVFATPLLADLVRLAVVDDQLETGTLHLLRLAPLAWLKEDIQTRFDNLPTEFGPVSLDFRLEAGGKTLAVAYGNNYREKPGRVVLHVPPLPGLREVAVNGRTFKAQPGGEVKLE